jgi:hypothetical protein
VRPALIPFLFVEQIKKNADFIHCLFLNKTQSSQKAYKNYHDILQIPLVQKTLGYTGLFEVGAAVACIGKLSGRTNLL